MSAVKLYHGGAGGLAVGDVIEPRPNARHIDGCAVCAARARGESVTIDGLGVDPPTGDEHAVYITSDRFYAKFYASLAQGDLYRVEPIGPTERSEEDPMVEAYRCERAVIVGVVERAVTLTEGERRRYWRRMGGSIRDYLRMAAAIRGGLLNTADELERAERVQ